MRVFREPCYFAEAVYLLYYFVNHISYEEDYLRAVKNYPCGYGEKGSVAERIRELMRVSAEVTVGMDPQEERLHYYFKKLPGTEARACCCLAQVMLMTVPLDQTDIDGFAGQLLAGYRYMQGEGIKINDLNPLGLVMERWEGPEEVESLAAQLERLPCATEAKWMILRALTDFEAHLRELTELIRPVAKRLRGAMSHLNAMNEEPLAVWSAYFMDHSVDDYQSEMFNTTFLFPKQQAREEIWLGIWNFNCLGSWSEYLDVPEGPEGPVRVAYIGTAIDFDLSVKKRTRPDEEALCGMLRVLGGKDKLEILRRCAKRPYSVAKLAAEMEINSGTVSRNLYGLYKMSYLDTTGDGERLNYVTRLDKLEQVFRWIMEYVSGE